MRAGPKVVPYCSVVVCREVGDCRYSALLQYGADQHPGANHKLLIDGVAYNIIREFKEKRPSHGGASHVRMPEEGVVVWQ